MLVPEGGNGDCVPVSTLSFTLPTLPTKTKEPGTGALALVTETLPLDDTAGDVVPLSVRVTLPPASLMVNVYPARAGELAKMPSATLSAATLNLNIVRIEEFSVYLSLFESQKAPLLIPPRERGGDELRAERAHHLRLTAGWTKQLKDRRRLKEERPFAL